MKTLLKMEVN